MIPIVKDLAVPVVVVLVQLEDDMQTRLVRWALPHKGRCTHLNSFEYKLRVIVFMPIWIALYLPTVIAIIFLAFSAPLGIATIAGFSGMMDGRFIGLSDDQKVVFSSLFAIWLLSFLLSKFVKNRFLTPH